MKGVAQNMWCQGLKGVVPKVNSQKLHAEKFELLSHSVIPISQPSSQNRSPTCNKVASRRVNIKTAEQTILSFIHHQKNQSMSDAYEKAKTGRLTYKGGSLATLKSSIDKKKHKKKKKQQKNKMIDETAAEPSSTDEIVAEISITETDNGAAEEELGYTIDAAKRMKYDELFPVEAKKFGYEPKKVSKSVEQVLDDRVKKKADRYCK